jgi:hypothetical protein
MAPLSPPHEHITGGQNGLRRYNSFDGILAVVAWLVVDGSIDKCQQQKTSLGKAIIQ